MKKSIRTRIKITGRGKILRRKMGQCHFRAKRSSTQLRRKAGHVQFPKSLTSRITKRPSSL